MSFLDDLLNRISRVWNGDTVMPFQPAIRFLGANVSDNTDLSTTDVNVGLTVQADGTALPQRGTINFTGGVASDDPTNQRTNVSGGWITALDIDFTSLPNASFPTDGTISLAGLSWTKGNSAHETTHVQVLNGVGLQWVPASTSNYSGPTRTLPYIWLPLSQVFGSAYYDWNTYIRMYVSVGADNAAANSDNLVVGIDSNSTDCGLLLFRGFLGSFLRVTPLYNFNSQIQFEDTEKISSTVKTMCLETQGLSAGALAFHSYWGSSIAAGAQFPTIAAMSLGSWGSQGIFGDPNGRPTSLPTQLGLVIGAQRNGSSTSYVTNVQRVRIDYRN